MERLRSLWQTSLETELWGNPIADWVVAASTFILALLAFLIVRRFFVGRLRGLADRTSASWDDVVVAVLERSSVLLFALVAVDLVAKPVLDLPAETDRVLDAIATVALFLQVGLWGMAGVARAVGHWAEGQEADGAQRTAGAAIVFLARLAIWSVVFLLVLSNLGVEVGALVAGLGVGGIAAALAVQSALGDLFAGFAIYLDRPFDIGDFIIVDDVLGNVDKIGIRSTRISSLGGETIIYPNGALLGSVVRNYRRMTRRRIVFQLGVRYSTPADDLEAAPGIIREIIEQRDDAEFNRAHFAGFAESSLTLEVVYYVLSRDYNHYMDVQHAINLAVVRAFQERGIGFAFPTRTLHLEDAATVPVRVDGARDQAREKKGNGSSARS